MLEVLSNSPFRDIYDMLPFIQVSLAAAGPGFNLKIWTKYQNAPINVDLVPVLEFKCIHLSESMDIYRALSEKGWVSHLSCVTSHKLLIDDFTS